MILENPEKASFLLWDEDYEILEICVCALSRSVLALLQDLKFVPPDSGAKYLIKQ